MRRAFTWGLPLYAAIMTGIFVGKGLPDNNLRAEGDPARSDNVKATAAAAPASSSPAPANGAAPYPIPAPTTQPKHLLHVIIRYEGDGMPDQSALGAALGGTLVGLIDDDKPKKSGKSKAAKASDMFQFIIRYEGDGIIDDNVAKVLKEYFAAEKAAGASASPRCAPKGPSLDTEETPPASVTPASGPRDSTVNPRDAVPASPRNLGPREEREGPAPAPAPAPRRAKPATLPTVER